MDDTRGKLSEYMFKLVDPGFEEACAPLDMGMEVPSELVVAELARLTVVSGYVGAAGAVECEARLEDVGREPE